jgi:hypothetical protein
LIEASAGAIILIIVAVLGTLPPGLQGEAKLKQFSAWAKRDKLVPPERGAPCSAATGSQVGQRFDRERSRIPTSTTLAAVA